jgi:hypothetical protein
VRECRFVANVGDSSTLVVDLVFDCTLLPGSDVRAQAPAYVGDFVMLSPQSIDACRYACMCVMSSPHQFAVCSSERARAEAFGVSMRGVVTGVATPAYTQIT